MKFTNATAAAVVLWLEVAARTASTSSSSFADNWPANDDAAVQRCISQSCGRVQSPASEACWARCRNLPRERRKWARIQPGKSLRHKHELLEEKSPRHKHELIEQDEKSLRHKHEVEQDEKGVGQKDPLEQGHIMGKKGVADQPQEDASDSIGKISGRDVVADFGTHGVLPVHVTSRLSKIVKGDTQKVASGFRPEPTLRSRIHEASAAAGESISSYAQDILDDHNNLRSIHSAPALTWSDDMANIAQHIAESCVYTHNTQAGGGGYGQNIGSAISPHGVPDFLDLEMYFDKMEDFPYGVAQPDMSNFESWAPFSQIVWNATTSVGCATVDCSSNGLGDAGFDIAPWFTVCNYSPVGNVEGEYDVNVAEPRRLRFIQRT